MGSFQRSLAVLFSIGLDVYLGLGVDTSRVPTSYPRDSTLESSSPFQVLLTRLSLCVALLSSKLQLPQRGF